MSSTSELDNIIIKIEELRESVFEELEIPHLRQEIVESNIFED